jgi:hypothetical protein
MTSFFPQERIYGSLSGSQLTIQFPAANGTIQSGTLTQAGVSRCNSAVEALRLRSRRAVRMAA